MGDHSMIKWTYATWNPVTGCTHVSEGCRNCYAERVLLRTGQSFDQVVCHPSRVEIPMHWKQPRRIFVNSLSDLFHEDVPDGFIDKIFAVMAMSGMKHTYQVLTKRPQRMLEYMTGEHRHQCVEGEYDLLLQRLTKAGTFMRIWPPKNVWLGISCEDQQTADERIPLLLQTPAAVRFISAEPLLGPLDMSKYLAPLEFAPCWQKGHTLTKQDYEAVAAVAKAAAQQAGWTRLDWVIVGDESGPHARPMHPDWARSLHDQCQAAGVPFFFKQWGEWATDQMLESGRGNTSRSRQMDGGRLCDSVWMTRFGKKAAGRILDWRTWNEMPEVKA